MIARFTLVVSLLPTLGLGPLPPGSSFDFHRPERTYVLPTELLEVSGLTDVDQHTVACLQDEAATMYLYDLRTGSVVKKLPFGAPGDFEGLTRVGDQYFALRSDGLVFRTYIDGTTATVLDTFRLAVPHHNIEGLGFDEARKRVLVAPKDFLKGDKRTRSLRYIYAFDPVTEKLDARPALTIDLEVLERQAHEAGIPFPMRTTDNGRSVPALKLRLSSVAVQPGTGHYYLLSALDHCVVVLDGPGNLVALHQLEPHLFPKPEGITFLPDGRLLISNEGKDAPPTLLSFVPR